jgi:hypothetical protein
VCVHRGECMCVYMNVCVRTVFLKEKLVWLLQFGQVETFPSQHYFEFHLLAYCNLLALPTQLRDLACICSVELCTESDRAIRFARYRFVWWSILFQCKQLIVWFVCLFVCFPTHIVPTKSSTITTCQCCLLPHQIIKITCHCKRLDRLLTRLGVRPVNMFHHCGDQTNPLSIHCSSELYVMFCQFNLDSLDDVPIDLVLPLLIQPRIRTTPWHSWQVLDSIPYMLAVWHCCLRLILPKVT